jgi:predicted small lipoprotein YifL
LDITGCGKRNPLYNQRGNQNPYIEEEQTTQWPKEKSAKGQTTIYKTYI